MKILIKKDATIKKLVIILISLCLFCMSCQKDKEEEYARKAILGTWEVIAHGIYIDTLSERTDGLLIEFLPDGSHNLYSPTYSSPEGHGGYLLRVQGRYAIKNDIFIEKYDSGFEERWKYRFFEDGEKLELINADWPPCAQTDGIHLEEKFNRINIRIYKKIINKLNN